MMMTGITSPDLTSREESFPGVTTNLTAVDTGRWNKEGLTTVEAGLENVPSTSVMNLVTAIGGTARIAVSTRTVNTTKIAKVLANPIAIRGSTGAGTFGVPNGGEDMKHHGQD